DEVLGRGMAKLPDERWDTCGALVAAAQTALGATLPARGPVVRARRSPRRWRMWGIVAMLAASGAVSSSLLRGGGTRRARADSLIRIDPARAKASAGVRVPGLPSSVRVCAASVFVASRDGTVAVVDPKTSTVYPVRIDGTPVDVSHVGNLAAVVSG